MVLGMRRTYVILVDAGLLVLDHYVSVLVLHAAAVRIVGVGIWL